jgi:heat shock protein HslJ
VCLATLAGCGDEPGGGAPVQSGALTGAPWQLVAGIDVAGWERVAPSVQFQNGTVSGSTGCNRFSTSYTLDGDKLTIVPPATTMMACDEPGQSVEPAFLAALGEVAGWRIEDGALALLDEDGGQVLRFDVASPVGTWDTTSFLQDNAVSSPLPGTHLTATFTDDGTLTGSAGCNTYTATYTAERGKIHIGQLATTRKLCTEPEGVMEQEQQYVAALPQATAYTVEGEQLSLLTPAGTFVATFTLGH